MSGMTRPVRWRQRQGYLMTELVVAAGLLITVMTLVASTATRIGRLWQETARQRTAVTELSNQLERLTLMPVERVREELNGLKPSAPAGAALPEPDLSGELVEDELGRRIVLRINWQRRHPGQPVEMVGWLSPLPETVSPEAIREGSS